MNNITFFDDASILFLNQHDNDLILVSLQTELKYTELRLDKDECKQLIAFLTKFVEQENRIFPYNRDVC